MVSPARRRSPAARRCCASTSRHWPRRAGLRSHDRRSGGADASAASVQPGDSRKAWCAAVRLIPRRLGAWAATSTSPISPTGRRNSGSAWSRTAHDRPDRAGAAVLGPGMQGSKRPGNRRLRPWSRSATNGNTTKRSEFRGDAMSSSAKAEAALALHRFGMGPRPGSIAAIESDPRGALIAELERSPSARDLGIPAAVQRQGLPRRHRCQCEAAGQGDRGHQGAEGSRQQDGRCGAMVEGATPGMSASAEKMAAEAIPDPGRPIYLAGGKAAHRSRARRRDRIRRAAGLVLVQSFLHLGRQDPEHVGRL